MVPTREKAMEIFLTYNETESLIRHGKAVEGVMRYFAKLYDEDIEKWGVVGLLHDLDYEKFPEQHCKKCVEILKEYDIDDEIIRGVVSHGFGICSDVEPIHKMEKILYATDELTGLITAAAMMRPSKSVMDLECKSLRKKYKSPSFAAGVNREVIEKGCSMLEVDLDFLMEETIQAMREIANEIGLKGDL